MADSDTSVKVAVRIRPLSAEEAQYESQYCLRTIPQESQILAGADNLFTFDHVFDHNTRQEEIYEECVVDLVNGEMPFLLFIIIIIFRSFVHSFKHVAILIILIIDDCITVHI